MLNDQAANLRNLVDSRNQIQFKTKKMSIDGKIDREKSGRLLAISSGKGGVGKTNFVINLAILLVKMKKKVVVVDLDLGLANIDILVSINYKYHIEDFVSGRKSLSEIICKGPKGVDVIPGGSGTPDLADLNDQDRQSFLDGFTSLIDTYDYVLLDTSAGISKNVVDFILMSDDLLIVTTPEPTAITDAYALIKVVSKRNKEIGISLIFNMVKSSGEAVVFYKKLNQVIRQFLKIPVRFLGSIPFDLTVKQSIMKRKAFVLQYPFSRASRSLQVVTRTIVTELPAQQEKTKSLFERFAMLVRKVS